MHLLAMEARFPHFINLFHYSHDGFICDINKAFTWQGHDYWVIKKHILELAQTTERANLEKIVDVNDFVAHIQNPEGKCDLR